MNTAAQRDEQAEAQAHVDLIARQLQEGVTYEEAGQDAEEWGAEADDIINAYDYLADCLDIEYRVSGDGGYRSASIMIACGGPNIWIDTGSKTVRLAWWGTTASACYGTDAMGIDEACEELWECR